MQLQMESGQEVMTRTFHFNPHVLPVKRCMIWLLRYNGMQYNRVVTVMDFQVQHLTASRYFYIVIKDIMFQFKGWNQPYHQTTLKFLLFLPAGQQEKNLSVLFCSKRLPSHPCPLSSKKVGETDNFAKQSCQIYFNTILARTPLFKKSS